MLDNELQNKMKHNAKKYLSWLYQFAPDKIKLAFFRDTVDLFNALEKSGISVMFRNQELIFQIPPNYHRDARTCLDTKTIPRGCVGAFEFGTKCPLIRINPLECENGADSYGAIVHERCHVSEETLVLAIDYYNNETLKTEFLMCLKSNIDKIDPTNVFGMKLDGRIYVDDTAKIEDHTLRCLNQAFYRLSITERFASAIEKQYTQQLDESLAEIIDLRTASSLNTIRNRYQCDEMTDHEIYDLLDKVHLDLHLGKQPTTALEAHIMYDLVAALSHQKGYLSHEDYEKTADKNLVSYELAKWNLEHEDKRVPFGAKTMVHDIKNISQYYMITDIASLPQAVQLNNPKLWAYAIANYGDKGAALVFDKSAFLDWCMSPDNDLSDAHMDMIAEHMGVEFSANNRRMAIERIKNEKETREMRERRQQSETYSFGIKKQNAHNHDKQHNHDIGIERK